jgi:uracil-DNA glycosylase family 4
VTTVERRRAAGLERLEQEVVACRRCPRLVAWREQVAREKRASFAAEEYWGRRSRASATPPRACSSSAWRPPPTAATARGACSPATARATGSSPPCTAPGLANQPTSVHRGDGLRLKDAWIAAAVRCAPPANKPTPEERDECLPWTVAELEHLTDLRVVVCLGAFAWDAALRLRAALGHPRPRRGRASATRRSFDDGAWLTLVGCFHPSQQNTFTRKLTEPMLDAVFRRARELAA